MNLFFSQVTVHSGWEDTSLQPVIQSVDCRPLNISLENLPAATWCKVRHSQPGTLTSLTWSVDWKRDQSALWFFHFTPVIFSFLLNFEGQFYKWLEGISAVSPQAHCFPFSCVSNQYAFFFFLLAHREHLAVNGEHTGSAPEAPTGTRAQQTRGCMCLAAGFFLQSSFLLVFNNDIHSLSTSLMG